MGGTLTQDRYTELEYVTDSETWIIAKYVLVSNANGGDEGVSSGFNGSTLINNGNIYSSIATGVRFAFGTVNGTLVNNAGALIKGASGIHMIGHASSITNRGTVIGSGGDDHFGIRFDGSAVLNNSGLIKATDPVSDGPISVGTPDAGETIVINNQAGGIIEGAGTAISTAGWGRIALTNRGTITGGIDINGSVGNVNDVVANFGRIAGNVLLGTGNDRFNGVAGNSLVRVFGEGGNDTLTGGTAADVLNGGAGIDTLRGGRGRDALTGGTERDFFDFNSALDSARGANRDVITDLSRAQDDRIDLRTIDADTSANPGNDVFNFIGTAAFHGGGGEVRCQSGIVQGDVNGDKVADFEIRVNLASLVAGDFLL